ncbi:hypothetical protein EX530_08175 [Xanthomonas phaseoli]
MAAHATTRSVGRQPTVWCGVLAACGTVGGMDAAIEPTRRDLRRVRERRGHRALEQLALVSKRIQQERAVCSSGLKAGRPSARRQLHCLQRCRIAANKRREPLSGGRGRRSERSARARHADSKHRPCA